MTTDDETMSCYDCGETLHDEPAPDGTETWVDSTGGDVCPDRETTGQPDQPHRPAREWTVTMTSMLITAPDAKTAIQQWEDSNSGGNHWEAREETNTDEQPDLAEMRQALAAIEDERAEGDKVTQIETLQAALDLALGRWPDIAR